MLLRVLASAVSSANRAGCIARDVINCGRLDIVDKGLNDFQTMADRKAQKCIIGSLESKFPGLKIIGEEGQLDKTDVEICCEEDNTVLSQVCPKIYENISLDDLVVWVDPLDVGISVKGKPTAGVICQPFFSDDLLNSDLQNKELDPKVIKEVISDTHIRSIWGVLGLGVFGLSDSIPQAPSLIDESHDENIIVTTRSHLSPAVIEAIKCCSPTKVLKVGGCGYKVLMLLEARAHAYIFASPGCKKWDTCAPEALLVAAGGKLTDIHGNYYNYDASVEHLNSGGVIATPVSYWCEKFVEKIPEELKNTLKTRSA